MKTFALALAVFVIPLAAGAAPVDPWTLAPSLPTACYSREDQFFEQATTQLEKTQAARYRQEAINREINERLNAIDPMEQQSRMMDYMMEHPEDMQKFMEATQSQGQAYSETAVAKSEEESRQKQVLDALVTRYEAALKAEMRPINEKLAKLPLCDGECASPPWAIAEAKSLYAQMDQEYLKLCGQWWKTGPYHSGLSAYRKLLAAKIPQQEELDASTRASNAMLGVEGNYRSVAPLQDVEHYTSLAQGIFSNRQMSPYYDQVKDW